MKTSLLFVVAALTASTAQIAQAGPIDIQVVPWLAPNAYGSPSFSGAADNAIQGIYRGQTSYGTAGTPTYFKAQSNVTSSEVIVTGFPSWKGHADPASIFGSAFANELGNRMTFGFPAAGDGSTQFSVADLSFVGSSTDLYNGNPYNGLGFAYSGGYTYSNQLMGVLYGKDGKLGGGDDTFITSGASSQLVDALVGRGSGNSFAAYCSGCTIAEQQAAIDSAASYPGAPFDFTGTYSITTNAGQYSGSGTFHVSVPEPPTVALMLAGLFVAGVTRYRPKSKAVTKER